MPTCVSPVWLKRLAWGTTPTASSSSTTIAPGSTSCARSSDLRENGLELSLDGYGCHVFLGFEEVSDADGAGWADLAQRLGLGGVPDAHVALRRMRDEPMREAVAAVFATRVAEEAFLPEAGADTETRTVLTRHAPAWLPR